MLNLHDNCCHVAERKKGFALFVNATRLSLQFNIERTYLICYHNARGTQCWRRGHPTSYNIQRTLNDGELSTQSFVDVTKKFLKKIAISEEKFIMSCDHFDQFHIKFSYWSIIFHKSITKASEA